MSNHFEHPEIFSEVKPPKGPIKHIFYFGITCGVGDGPGIPLYLPTVKVPSITPVADLPAVPAGEEPVAIVTNETDVHINAFVGTFAEFKEHVRAAMTRMENQFRTLKITGKDHPLPKGEYTQGCHSHELLDYTLNGPVSVQRRKDAKEQSVFEEQATHEAFGEILKEADNDQSRARVKVIRQEKTTVTPNAGSEEVMARRLQEKGTSNLSAALSKLRLNKTHNPVATPVLADLEKRATHVEPPKPAGEPGSNDHGPVPSDQDQGDLA